MLIVMGKVGLLFGSFNPIHNGHIAIAEKCLSDGLVDCVNFVVAEQNPFKEKYSVKFYDRALLVQKAIEYNEKFLVSYIEKIFSSFHISTKTYDVINQFKKIYPNNEYYIICGDDMYNQISEWYKGAEILKENKFIIFSRDNKNIIYSDNIKYINIDGFEDISSSKIRKMINNNDDVSNLIPSKVYEIIKVKNFYKK